VRLIDQGVAHPLVDVANEIVKMSATFCSNSRSPKFLIKTGDDIARHDKEVRFKDWPSRWAGRQGTPFLSYERKSISISRVPDLRNQFGRYAQNPRSPGWFSNPRRTVCGSLMIRELTRAFVRSTKASCLIFDTFRESTKRDQ